MARTEEAKSDLNCILIDIEGVFVVKQTGVGYQLIKSRRDCGWMSFYYGGRGGGIRVVISGWWDGWRRRGMEKCRSTSLIHCSLAPDSELKAAGSCMSLFSSSDC